MFFFSGMPAQTSDEEGVRPSVKRVHCDKTGERSVQIFIPYESIFSLVFWKEEWLVGGDPFYLIFWDNRPILERNRRLTIKYINTPRTNPMGLTLRLQSRTVLYTEYSYNTKQLRLLRLIHTNRWRVTVAINAKYTHTNDSRPTSETWHKITYNLCKQFHAKSLMQFAHAHRYF